MIAQFFGKDRYLSNFWYVPQKVTLDGILDYNDGLWYPTVEHAYQAAKSTDYADRYALAVNINEPSEAKRYGATIQVQKRKDWQQVNLIIMHELLRQKFNQQPLKRQLIATGDQELVEGNHWHDNFFGVCSCDKCKTKEQYNHLGKLLMLVRTELLTKP